MGKMIDQYFQPEQFRHFHEEGTNFYKILKPYSDVNAPAFFYSTRSIEQIMLNHDLAIYNSIPVKGSNPTITHIHEGYTMTTPSVNWGTGTTGTITISNYTHNPVTYKDALEFTDLTKDSSSPTISIIKSKTKKSMFKSDIISF
jgi:hypothetical protein